METSRRLWKLEAPNGAELCKYTLRGERGEWLGDVTLEYSGAKHRLEMHVISDFGNYGYRWMGAGGKGYAKFLLDAGCDYIAEKLAAGHYEGNVLNADRTREAILEQISVLNESEDADYLGELRCDLENCESEVDFYNWAEEHGYEDVCEEFRYCMGGYLPGLRARLLPELMALLKFEEVIRSFKGAAEILARAPHTAEETNRALKELRERCAALKKH